MHSEGTAASPSATAHESQPVPSSTHSERSTATVTTLAQPPETVVVGGGDYAAFPTLRNLVSNSTMVARATVEELLPGVFFGDPPHTGWAVTPTRLRVTDLLDGDTRSDRDPVVLQSGGTRDGLTIRYDGQTVFAVGTDVIVFAYPTRDPYELEHATYLLTVAAAIGPDGRLLPGAWTEVAPSLQGMTVAEIADAVRSL